ncbi:MAG: aspartate--tRNA ligase [Armatimonadetes bacterium]|jgi:aspartyl-tRNA synthetase|nr:aspartate--tRNA ligase [Armatimonadota bacterium]
MVNRTHGAGTLRTEQIGETVTLAGWVRRRRDQGGVIFIDLWDRSGLVQTVFDSSSCPDAHAVADQCRGEFVLTVTGRVRHRPEGTVNPKLATGEVEVEVQSAQILNASKTPPFQVTEERIAEEIRLEHRYIDLRRAKMQTNLELRHRVTLAARNFLSEEGFWEIETPCLIRSTPEGARDYVVPSRVQPGHFYALPQSPQLFKQMLQVSGVEKYFQIARCFRDESSRADRQPEFTQIDMEMSFVTQDDVFGVWERLMQRLWKVGMDVDLTLPFPRMSYAESMARYGSDKPDTRFGMELTDFGDIFADAELRVLRNALASGGQIKGIVAPGCGGYSRKQIDDLTALARQFGAGGLVSIILEEGTYRSSIQKYLSPEQVEAIKARTGATDGDLLLIVADKPKVVADALGRLRLHLGNELGLIDPSKWNFLWVLDFPLFEEGDHGLEPMHHPFSHPKTEEDLKLLYEDPIRVTATLYDLVANGAETASGSIRVHNAETQLRVLEVIGINREEAWKRFGFMLNALTYGAPPHGGIASGLDRIIMLMAGEDNIRDVIAFPKAASGYDPMLDCPAPLETEQLAELRLAVLPPEESDAEEG